MTCFLIRNLYKSLILCGGKFHIQLWTIGNVWFFWWNLNSCEFKVKFRVFKSNKKFVNCILLKIIFNASTRNDKTFIMLRQLQQLTLLAIHKLSASLNYPWSYIFSSSLSSAFYSTCVNIFCACSIYLLLVDQSLSLSFIIFTRERAKNFLMRASEGKQDFFPFTSPPF